MQRLNPVPGSAATTTTPTSNRAIAAALLAELAGDGDPSAALDAAAALARVCDDTEAAWLPEEALAAVLSASGGSLSRRVGYRILQSAEVGFWMRFGGVATPKNTYGRCDQLLARERPEGRYFVIRNDFGSARILYDGGIDTRADEHFCALRAGMLEAVPTRFGLLPAEVEEATCAARGDSCCVYEVRYHATLRSGLALGGLLGMSLGACAGFAVGAGPGVTALATVLGMTLFAVAGRSVDLSRMLAALGASQRGVLAVADHLDRTLAEKMDRLARLEAISPESRAPAGGPRTLRHQDCDLRRLVRTAVDEHRARIPDALEVRFELPDEPVELTCDALQMEMLVVALLRNAGAGAIEYADGDGRVHATLSLAPVVGGVELTVRDDGCGLEDADTAFDPFLGEVSQRPGDPENGLRAACRIVDDHGGELRIESAAGRGNLVTALLLDRAPTCADGTLEMRAAAVECAEFEELALPLAG
jgi:hypothetical protein